MTTWQDAARILYRAGEVDAARAVLHTAMLAHPDDVRPRVGLAELAAMADDQQACAQAVAPIAAEALTPCLSDDADVALRLAQLWVIHAGRDRRSRAWLDVCLAQMDGYVAPVASGLTPDDYAAATAPFLAARAADAPHPADALSLWRDWLDPSDGPVMRSEVLLSQAGAILPSFWGWARLRASYAAMHAATRADDAMGLLPLFADDGAYGAHRFRLSDGAVVSHDQLMSARDLNLLAGWIGLSAADAPLLIDIGAGYGRLVHRFLQAFPSARAWALDAVPGTNAMAAHYLAFRGCAGRVALGGPGRLREEMPAGAPRIAVNVHSWSEAPLASIEAWLQELRADWLFLVTHDQSAVTLEADGPPREMLPAILAAGWVLQRAQPRFPGLACNTGFVWLFSKG